MNCPNCSTDIKPKTRFCPSCGFNVEAISAKIMVPDIDPKIAALETALGNKYKILRKIGAGGFADVYLGEHTQLGRQVAIKILRVAEDEEMIERFRREARAAAKLSHPNIIDIYDVGDAANIYYFVMKYVPGDTLSTKMRREKKILPAVAIDITKQLVDALAYAHDRGVVHRDIKPANVLLDEFGKPVLMDFGIARMAFVGQLTRTGTLMGTPHYLPPEQPLGKPVDGRSDIYSLGIMFYEMLAGRVPFHDDAAIALIYKHINETPPPLTSIAPELAPQLAAIVHKMIEKQQENRFQSAHDLYEALEDLYEIYPSRTTPARRGTTGNKDTERLMLLAEEHGQQSKFAQALEIYGTLIARRPDNQQVQQKRDSVLTSFVSDIRQNIRQGEFQKAWTAVTDLKRVLPQDTHVPQLIADLESAEQKFTKDKEYRSHFEAAQTALKHDNASSAVDHLTKALTINPSSDEAKTLLRDARAAYETNKRKAEYANVFAEAEYHFQQQSFDEALAAIQRALKLDQNPQAIELEEKIRAALKEKSYRESEERNIASEVDRLCEQLNFNDATRFLQSVRQDAPQLVKTLTPKVNRNRDLYLNFVDASERYEEGKLEEATRLFEQFLSTPLPYEFQAFYGLRKQAEEHLKALRPKLEANEFEQQLKRADTLLRLGHIQEARQICLNVLAKQPDHVIAKAKLAEIDRELKGPDHPEFNTDELLRQIEAGTVNVPKPELPPEPLAEAEIQNVSASSTAPIAPPVQVVTPPPPAPVKQPVAPQRPVRKVQEPVGVSPFMKYGLGAAGAIAIVAVLLFFIWSPSEENKPIPVPPKQAEQKNPAPTKKDVPPVPVVQPVSVAIDVRPWAEVKISGKNISKPISSVTPARIDLPPGEYSVLCTNPDFASFTQTIKVSDTDRSFRLQFQQLDPNQVVDSLLR
jgi:serine/threonine protein kinase